MLPSPDCRYGYTRAQVKAIMGARAAAFDEWMYGSTMMLCDGLAYVHETGQYVPDCPTAHGVVTYCEDVERFLAGLAQDD